MKRLFRIVPMVLGAVLALQFPAKAAELGVLKVLYVGDAGPQRSLAFQSFLKPHVAKADTAVLGTFKPESAKEYDVIVVDWHQSLSPTKPNPLGSRKTWTKPTVLLGSAGLNLATVWQTKGAYG
jgi:hypothetical protein